MPGGYTLLELPGVYSICRLPTGAAVDWAGGDFCCVMRSLSEAQETTVVCESGRVPHGVERDDGWHCFRFAGAFAFGETGVLDSVLSVLAGAKVPALAQSTFETDYVLVKAERVAKVVDLLREAGHEVLPAE